MPEQPHLQLEREFDLKWRLGARASAVISHAAESFGSSIRIAHADDTADAKSIVDLLTLGGRKAFQDTLENSDTSFSWSGLEAGSRIKITASGADAHEALATILNVLSCPDPDRSHAAEHSPSS